MADKSLQPTDFRALFEAIPSPFLVCLPDSGFTIIAASDSYLQVTNSTREGLLGRALFEAFPANPERPDASGARNLRASFLRVIATRGPDRMPVQRYDIARPGGGFDERHWRPSNTPVLSRGGEVTQIIHHVEDVTESVRLRREGVEQKLDEAALRESAAWFSTTLNSIGDAVIATDFAGRVAFMNGVAEHLTGWASAEARGRPLAEVFVIIGEETRVPAPSPVDKVLDSGKVQGLANHTLLIARDGAERPIEDSAAPIVGDDGRISGIVLVFRDATAKRASEKALAASDAFSRRIIESSPDCLKVMDFDGRLLSMNESGCRLMEIDDFSRCVGMPWVESWPEDARSTVIAAIEEAKQGRTARFQCECPTAKGTIKWWDVTVSPLVDVEGGPRRLLSVSRDITERVRAEAERERLAAESEKDRRIYHAALSNTLDLVYVFDLEHRFIYANEALLGMWGLGLQEAIGKTCLELGYEPWHAEMHDGEIDQVVATRRPIRGEVPFTGTGGRRVYDYIFTPVIGADGSVQAVAGTTRDVTDRKRSEEVLKDNDRRKDEFLAMLAHELRNPLASIRNAVTVAARAGTPEDIEWSLEVINRQVLNFGILIDDLLDVARITRGKIQLRKVPVDAASIIRRAVDTVRPQIVEKRHELTLAVGPSGLHLEADPTRLEQILVNLLSNAAKYTPPGGRIRLSAGLEAGEVVIRIRDDGIGISPEMLPRLFELFGQADQSLARSEGGLGIGLTLARTLAELHGGTITATSAGAGLGSEFIARFPATEAPAAAIRPPMAPAFDRARSLEVLVVDDNVDSAKGMARLLLRSGHAVRIATFGPDAIEAASTSCPEVVLLDIGLPGMDGYEVAKKLRQEICPTTRIIAVSGYGDEESRRRTAEAGFDHHLVKPVDFDALLSLMHLP